MKFSKNLMNRRLKDIYVRNEISKDLKNGHKKSNDEDELNNTQENFDNNESLPKIDR